MACVPHVRTSWALPCWALMGFLSPLLAQRASEARQAAAEAMNMLEPGHRMTLEAEQGWAIAERFEGGQLLLALTDASPNLGGLLVEVRRCCERLAR